MRAAPISRVLSEFPLSKWAVLEGGYQETAGAAGRDSLFPPALPPSRVSARQGEQALCCSSATFLLLGLCFLVFISFNDAYSTSYL